MPECAHEDFGAAVSVGRITDGDDGPVDSYLADIEVRCLQCDLPFRFLGLSSGLDFRGARVSVDGLKAHLALAPKGIDLPPPAMRGYGVSFHGPDEEAPDV